MIHTWGGTGFYLGNKQSFIADETTSLTLKTGKFLSFTPDCGTRTSFKGTLTVENTAVLRDGKAAGTYSALTLWDNNSTGSIVFLPGGNLFWDTVDSGSNSTLLNLSGSSGAKYNVPVLLTPASGGGTFTLTKENLLTTQASNKE